MKEEPVDSRDDRDLCEIWKKANQRQWEDFNPRVVLFRADVESFGRWDGPNPPHIKEEQEEVSIKQEEEVITLTSLYVKSEEDVPLLLLHDAPDRDGFIHSLTVHRVNLQRQLDCVDFIKNKDTAMTPSSSLGFRVGLSGLLDSDEEQASSNTDHSENRHRKHPSVEENFQKTNQKSHCHKSKSGRSQGTKRNTVENMKSKPMEEHVLPQCSRRKQDKSSDKTKEKSCSEPFRCQDCGVSFTFSANLNRHRRVHTGQRPFSCTVCDRSFAQNYNLKSHMSTCHSDHFPHSCSLCKKGFASTEALESHMLRHTVKHKKKGMERPVCPECGKSFSQKDSLRTHMSLHTGQYSLTCTLCGKGYNRAFDFEVHMRIHTGERPFSCSQCGTAFKSVSHYNLHMRIHSGEKPFSCPVCNRGFSRSTHVTSHMKVHRTKKAFTCKLCFKEYSNIDFYKKHMKIHYIQEKYGVTSYGCTNANT